MWVSAAWPREREGSAQREGFTADTHMPLNYNDNARNNFKDKN